MITKYKLITPHNPAMTTEEWEKRGAEVLNRAFDYEPAPMDEMGLESCLANSLDRIKVLEALVVALEADNDMLAARCLDYEARLK